MPRLSKKQRVLDYVGACGWTRIGRAEWASIRSALPDVSENAIRECGIPVAPPWCGVRQHTIDELEASLAGFSEVYASQPDLRRYCRDQVIAAKDRARLASRSFRVDDTTRRLKAEMVEWMLVWLGDPAIFPEWAALRRERMDSAAGGRAQA